MELKAHIAAPTERGDYRSNVGQASVGLCVIGISLRVFFFLFDKNLWLDEATASLSIVHRGFLGLCKPLEYAQMAPLGFLWAVKSSVLALGDHDLAFRVPSLLAGVLAVLLFQKVVKLAIPEGGIPALAALATFALSPTLIGYVCQAKVYGVDALCSVILLLFGMRALQSRRPADSLWLGAVATAVCWFSFPSCFVLGAVGLALMADALKLRDWKRLRASFAATATATLSFVAQYWFIARQPAKVMEGIWANEWIRLAPRTMGELKSNWDLLTQSLADPFGFPFTSLGLLVLALAIAQVWNRRDWRTALVLGGPVLLCLIGSSVTKYPWIGRFLLFLVPMSCLATGLGVRFIQTTLERQRFRGPALAFAALLVIPLASDAGLRASRPLKHHGFTEVMRIIEAKGEPGGTLFVDNQSTPVFRFYDHRHGYSERFRVLGLDVYMDDDVAYRARLKSMARPGGKIWVIFPDHYIGWPTHLWTTLATLDAIGHREESVELFHSSAYLYRF
ncbi:MAG: glycosyltransferase family 39 protein [Verrucomicrobiota bacterium]